MKIYLLICSSYDKEYTVSVSTDRDDIKRKCMQYKPYIDDDHCLSIEELDTDIDGMYFIIQFDRCGKVRDIWVETDDEYAFGEVELIREKDDYIRIAVKANNVGEAIQKAEDMRENHFKCNPKDK